VPVGLNIECEYPFAVIMLERQPKSSVADLCNLVGKLPVEQPIVTCCQREFRSSSTTGILASVSQTTVVDRISTPHETAGFGNCTGECT
jgi:hypothetical protein